MAMISFRQAWERYATPAERAVAAATNRISRPVAERVAQRAREDGYLISKGTHDGRPTKRRRKHR